MTTRCGLADLLKRDPSTNAFDFLWLDETVQPTDPLEVIPLAQYYPDVETAFARTSWTDEATWVALVSRPLGGHFWAEICARYGLSGTGHNHPEQGTSCSRGGARSRYTAKGRPTTTTPFCGCGGDGEMWPDKPDARTCRLRQ